MLHNNDNSFESLAFDNYKNHLRRDLIRDMSDNQMEPEGDLIIDGTTHEYDVCRDGQHKKARYTATWDSFGSREPIFVCSYGLIDEGWEYVYSSAMPQKHNQ